MAKRGRPAKNGVKPWWTLHRWFMVLYAYNQARTAGDKHSSAVREAVVWIREKIPGMPISETGVRRIVAELQPKGVPFAYRVSKLPDEEVKQATAMYQEALGVPEAVFNVGFSFGIGPRPVYPRHNGKLSATPVSEARSSGPHPSRTEHQFLGPK